jgi:hypothetical protein
MMMKSTGDACCGKEQFDQAPYKSTENYCCGGVLSDAIVNATDTNFWGYKLERNRLFSRDAAGNDWNMTGHWGYGRNGALPASQASLDTTHRERMCVINSSSNLWFNPVGGSGNAAMASDQLYDVEYRRWDESNPTAYSPPAKCVLGNTDLTCCSNGTLPGTA